MIRLWQLVFLIAVAYGAEVWAYSKHSCAPGGLQYRKTSDQPLGGCFCPKGKKGIATPVELKDGTMTMGGCTKISMLASYVCQNVGLEHAYSVPLRSGSTQYRTVWGHEHSVSKQRLIFMGSDDGVAVYKWDPNLGAQGQLVETDFEDTDGVFGIWADDEYVYLADGSYLRTFDVDYAAGTLFGGWTSPVHGSDNEVLGVVGDGSYLYTAEEDRLRAYTVGPTGALTMVDEELGANVRGVWPDARGFDAGGKILLYVGWDLSGFYAASFDGSSLVNEYDISTVRGKGAWHDGSYAYLAGEGTGNIYVYNNVYDAGANPQQNYDVDSFESVNQVHAEAPGGSGERVWGDGEYVYLAGGNGGVDVYQVNDTGVLEHKVNGYEGSGAYSAVWTGYWGDYEKMLFVAAGDAGGEVYKVQCND